MCSALLHFWVKFKRDKKGTVVVLFAGAFLLLGIVTGTAVDTLRWQTAYYRTQTAMDAAVLAAGRVLQLPGSTQDDVVGAARRFYNNNKTSYLDLDTVEFNYNQGEAEVRATSAGSYINMTFLKLIGLRTLPITVESVAALDASDIEISLMLDITGSMGENNKLEDLKIAAKDLIDIVMADSLFENKSRIALVPFSPFVNVGDAYFETVTGVEANGAPNVLTCVAERDTLNRYTDVAPGVGEYFSHIQDLFPAETMCPTQTTIMPLSDNPDELKPRVENLTIFPTSTAGHIGTAWTWYTLSEKWRDVWPSGSKPETPGGAEKVRKIAVLMTDGMYNAEHSGDPSSIQARETCDNMKAQGIIIYAVAFDVPKGGEADITMQQCASSFEHHYNAANGEALKLAYREIALKIFSLRLTR